MWLPAAAVCLFCGVTSEVVVSPFVPDNAFFMPLVHLLLFLFFPNRGNYLA